MKSKMLFLLLVLMMIEASASSSFEDKFHSRLMEIGWSRTIDEIDRYAPDEQKIILGQLLIARSQDLLPREQISQNCLNKAQDLLLASPGHADYYKDKIEFYRSEALINAGRTGLELTEIRDLGKEVITESNFMTYCETTAFRALGLLPSPETVAVLGHYLNDELGADGKTLTGKPIHIPSDASAAPLIREMAAMALRKLEIENPPFKKADSSDEMNFTTEGEVEAWKDWWNEIVAGNRTYRFIGSGIEYGSDGPASSEQLEKIERNRRREMSGSAGARLPHGGKEDVGTDSNFSKTVSIIALFASCMLLAFGVWFVFRKRSSAV